MSKNQLANKSKKSKISKVKINEYKEAFDIFDKDKNGIIATNDIMKIMNLFSYPITRRNIQKMIKDINVSGDGKFDFKNFVNLMQKQNDYIDENTEEMVLESFKDEYLGNKRKRENSNDNETSFYDTEFLLLNYQNNMMDEKKNSEDVFIKIEDSTDNIIQNIKWNKNQKLDKKINSLKDNNIYNIGNFNSKKSSRKTGNMKYNNKKSEQNEINKRRKNIKREKKWKNSMETENNIIINKKNLPQDLIEQIKSKIKNSKLSPIKLNKTPFREKIFPLKQPVTNFSSKLITDFDLNNISNIKPGEISFDSDISFDFLNKPIIPINNNNFKFNKSHATDKNKKEKDLNCSSEILLNGIKEKLEKKELDIKLNKNKNKPDSGFQKNSDNNFFNLEINNKIKNNNYLVNNILTVYKRNKGECNLNNNYYFLKENENKEEIEKNKKISIIPNLKQKFLNNNIQILTTFELEYRKNRKGEKIIKKATEIPYLIIIEKNNFDLENNLNITQIKKSGSYELQKKIKNSKLLNLNQENNLKKNITNEEICIFSKNKNKKLKNAKNIIKGKKNLKKNEIPKRKINELERINYENQNEENNMLNIANIMSNSSIENESKDIKNNILQEKTFIDEDFYNEWNNYEKYNDKNKKDKAKDNDNNDKDLTTIDVLNGFNYLYQQKIQ